MVLKRNFCLSYKQTLSIIDGKIKTENIQSDFRTLLRFSWSADNLIIFSKETTVSFYENFLNYITKNKYPAMLQRVFCYTNVLTNITNFMLGHAGQVMCTNYFNINTPFKNIN